MGVVSDVDCRPGCRHTPVALQSNLKIQIEVDTGSPIARGVYAKVTGTLEAGSQGFCIHMTSLPPELARWLELQRTASTH